MPRRHSARSGEFALSDTLPEHTSYVSGPICSSGQCAYDARRRTISWQGRLPEGDAGGEQGGYTWGDSDGGGEVPGVRFDWIDVRQTDANAGGGDEGYYCGLPIGFSFPFLGVSNDTFCVSTNGFVSLDLQGWPEPENACPMSAGSGSRTRIAAMWDDLVVDDGVYYQTFGAAPRRSLVVQWAGVHHLLDPATFDMQMILYEDGAIQVQCAHSTLRLSCTRTARSARRCARRRPRPGAPRPPAWRTTARRGA
jgi:hypothetical protein